MDAARDPFDELTALFLSDEPSAGAALGGIEGTQNRVTDRLSQPKAVKPRLTIAICGHLPVMAGLWVTQYADRIAEKSGSTGLVRLEGGRCSIEIFRSDTNIARPQGADLAKSAGIIADRLHRWVVCVDDRDAAEAVRAGADEVVILTAAEQPAVIEAYRLAKSAAARVPAESSLDLGLVVVGADPERAESAGDVLAEAAIRHLDRPLPVVATVRRLDVVEGSQRLVFDESVRRSPQEVVSAIRASLDLAELRPETGGHPEIAGETNPEPRPHLGGLRLARFEDSSETPEDVKTDSSSASHRQRTDAGSMQPLFPSSEAASEAHSGADSEAETGRPRNNFRSVRLRPSPMGAPGEPAFSPEEDASVGISDSSADGPETSQSAAASRLGPIDGSTVDASPTAESSDAGLAGFLPELKLTGFRCPIAPGIELAADAEGGVHVCCLDEDLESARIADAWLHRNRDLVTTAMAFSGVSTIHVFTTNPPRVADLHRTGLRLHLIIDDGGTRRSIPLNSEQNAIIPG
jgi:hypothetical protein